MVEYTYDTWGKKVTTTGTLAGTLGLFQPFRYRGYVYDWETGLYYLQSRYYDPAVGRFISADILLSTGQGVLGHNCYAYCLGNPVMRADEGGCTSGHVGNLYRTWVETYTGRDVPVCGLEHMPDVHYLYDLAVERRHLNCIIKNISITNDQSAIFYLSNCYDDVKYFVSRGLTDWLCDQVANTILKKYKNENNRNFYANKKELSFETSEHLTGYLWSQGEQGYSCPFVYCVGYCVAVLFEKEEDNLRSYVENHCNRVEYKRGNLFQDLWYYVLH